MESAYRRCLASFGVKDLECDAPENTRASAEALADFITTKGQFSQYAATPIAKAVLAERHVPELNVYKLRHAVLVNPNPTTSTIASDCVAALMFGSADVPESLERLSSVCAQSWWMIKRLGAPKTKRAVENLLSDWNGKETLCIHPIQFNVASQTVSSAYRACRVKLDAGLPCEANTVREAQDLANIMLGLGTPVVREEVCVDDPIKMERTKKFLFRRTASS
jgi:hypothetical protein